jgi:hypothetical protein
MTCSDLPIFRMHLAASVQKLKAMYGSGSTSMYNLAREIDMTSETIFEKLNSHVQSEHRLFRK